MATAAASSTREHHPYHGAIEIANIYSAVYTREKKNRHLFLFQSRVRVSNYTAN